MQLIRLRVLAIYAWNPHLPETDNNRLSSYLHPVHDAYSWIDFPRRRWHPTVHWSARRWCSPNAICVLPAYVYSLHCGTIRWISDNNYFPHLCGDSLREFSIPYIGTRSLGMPNTLPIWPFSAALATCTPLKRTRTKGKRVRDVADEIQMEIRREWAARWTELTFSFRIWIRCKLFWRVITSVGGVAFGAEFGLADALAVPSAGGNRGPGIVSFFIDAGTSVNFILTDMICRLSSVTQTNQFTTGSSPILFFFYRTNDRMKNAMPAHTKRFAQNG